MILIIISHCSKLQHVYVYVLDIRIASVHPSVCLSVRVIGSHTTLSILTKLSGYISIGNKLLINNYNYAPGNLNYYL